MPLTALFAFLFTSHMLVKAIVIQSLSTADSLTFCFACRVVPKQHLILPQASKCFEKSFPQSTLMYTTVQRNGT
ncbi:hypothetical protein T03_14282 [Trichinella britovi]|uniref:Secreted protein n=1 Tax=Trichinella britovi TaxID=45882 RepID=A0A0V1C7U0_TRIBR|nr:hypothetical protein T03_14282 [Trichinella britovi]